MVVTSSSVQAVAYRFQLTYRAFGTTTIPQHGTLISMRTSTYRWTTGLLSQPTSLNFTAHSSIISIVRHVWSLHGVALHRTWVTWIQVGPYQRRITSMALVLPLPTPIPLLMRGIASTSGSTIPTQWIRTSCAQRHSLRWSRLSTIGLRSSWRLLTAPTNVLTNGHQNTDQRRMLPHTASSWFGISSITLARLLVFLAMM